MFILGGVVLLMHMLKAIFKLKNNKKKVTTKKVVGFRATFFANNSKIQDAVKEALEEKLKKHYDIDTVEEFKEYIIKSVSSKAYVNIVSKNKILSLFISQDMMLNIVNGIIDPLLDQLDDSLEDLFKTVCSWNEIPVQENIIQDDIVSTGNDNIIPPMTIEASKSEDIAIPRVVKREAK